jgi:hypothetical protein
MAHLNTEEQSDCICRTEIAVSLYNILATLAYTILITNVWNDPAKLPNLFISNGFLFIDLY